MKAAAGFRKAISQVMPALMTFSMMKVLIPPMTISSRSPTLSLIHFHRPGMPSVTRTLKTSTVCSSLVDDLLADELDHAGADLAVGEAEDLHHQVEDPGDVEALRAAGCRRRPIAPNSQPIRPSCRWRGDVADEAAQARLDAVDQVAEEADRVGDDVADHVRGLGQDAQQHVLELDDRLDHAARPRRSPCRRGRGWRPSSRRCGRRARRATRRTCARACRRARTAWRRRRPSAARTGRRASTPPPCRPSAGPAGAGRRTWRSRPCPAAMRARAAVRPPPTTSATLPMTRVHVGQVAGLALGVEGVDLARHARATCP